jgi:outer membrane protein OmpA-like peptidoglycan-associated protein
MRFTPAEIKDDGATTSQAAVQYSNSKMSGPATINWSVDGPAFGATVSATGLVTPGTDTVPITKDKVKVKIKAVDSVQAGANTTGNVTVWNRKFLQAKADFPKFVATTYKQLNYHQGINGNFDAAYNPAKKTLGIEVRVAFNFVDDLAGAAKWNAATKKTFASQFITQVHKAWSGQYQFQNIAEPKLMWKKLNPISVRVNAKQDAAAPHFTATVHKKQVTDAVHGATADFSAASQTPNKNPFPGTGAAELTALQAKTPTPIQFAAGSNAIGAADQPKVQFLGTYLHSIHQPKFQLTVTGHAAPDPAAVTPAQKTAAAHTAMTLSKKRANTVKDTIRAAGNAQHKISVVAKGDTAGVAAPLGDKVEIASVVDPSYVNVQPVLPHEFGHMLGLGDEYANATHPVGANATHYGLTKDALGQDLADSFAKITVDAEGIMQGGKDVRPMHYVTLWAALGDAAATAAVPAPPFARADWKFVGM